MGLGLSSTTDVHSRRVKLTRKAGWQIQLIFRKESE